MALISCPECSNKVSDKAPLCMRCGYPLPNFSNLFGKMVSVAEVEPIKTRGALTKAQCTNCNAMLEVDASIQSATCPFCNTSYIVEQAINNYNINIASNNMNISSATINMAGDGHTVDNYLKRAKQFLDQGVISSALEYYDKVLDIDADNEEARATKKNLLEKAEFFVGVVQEGMFSKHKVVLKYDRIEYRTPDKVWKFELKDMSNIMSTPTSFQFTYSVGGSRTWPMQGAEKLRNAVEDLKRCEYCKYV